MMGIQPHYNYKKSQHLLLHAWVREDAKKVPQIVIRPEGLTPPPLEPSGHMNLFCGSIIDIC